MHRQRIDRVALARVGARAAAWLTARLGEGQHAPDVTSLFHLGLRLCSSVTARSAADLFSIDASIARLPAGGIDRIESAALPGRPEQGACQLASLPWSAAENADFLGSLALSRLSEGDLSGAAVAMRQSLRFGRPGAITREAMAFMLMHQHPDGCFGDPALARSLDAALDEGRLRSQLAQTVQVLWAVNEYANGLRRPVGADGSMRGSKVGRDAHPCG